MIELVDLFGPNSLQAGACGNRSWSNVILAKLLCARRSDAKVESPPGGTSHPVVAGVRQLVVIWEFSVPLSLANLQTCSLRAHQSYRGELRLEWKLKTVAQLLVIVTFKCGWSCRALSLYSCVSGVSSTFLKSVVVGAFFEMDANSLVVIKPEISCDPNAPLPVWRSGHPLAPWSWHPLQKALCASHRFAVSNLPLQHLFSLLLVLSRRVEVRNCGCIESSSSVRFV